jgi:hypothetical protein
MILRALKEKQGHGELRAAREHAVALIVVQQY